MAIDGQTLTHVEGLITDVDTTEASFRTGVGYVLTEVDSLNTAPAPSTNGKLVIEQTGSGTFSVPAGITTLYVTLAGGGGSGSAQWYTGSYKDNHYSDGGGGGGVTYNMEMSVTSEQSIEYFVGAGGAGVTQTVAHRSTAGNAGQATTFGGISGGGGGGSSCSGYNDNVCVVGTGGSVVLSSGFNEEYGTSGNDGTGGPWNQQSGGAISVFEYGVSIGEGGHGHHKPYSGSAPSSLSGGDGIIIVEW